MSAVQNELMHYGVLGMKWGRRQTDKLTKSRDSVSRAMRYNAAAMKNSRGGKSASRELASFANKFSKKPISELDKKQIRDGEKAAARILADRGFGYITAKSFDKGRRFKGFKDFTE